MFDKRGILSPERTLDLNERIAVAFHYTNTRLELAKLQNYLNRY